MATLSSSLQAVILAAGRSQRFARHTTKLMEKICGKELIRFPIKACESLSIPITLVVGHHKEEIVNCLTHYNHQCEYVVQQEARGTGDALRCAIDNMHADTILVLCGDMPLLAHDILQNITIQHTQTRAAISLVISHYTDMHHGYGRIIEDKGRITIAEARDCTDEQKKSCWINAGIYLFDREFLTKHINSLSPSLQTQEYYLTDLINIASNNGFTVTTHAVPFDLVRGINTITELATTQELKRHEIIEYWMAQGVIFSSPATTHIDSDVLIEKGTVIGAGAHIIGATVIGKNCTIGPYTIIENSHCHDYAAIDAYSLIRNSTLCAHALVGPYAHIRDHTVVGNSSVIGNFVEVKKSTIGAYSKAKHLAYLGDASIGDHVNIGAGTITCNHNGVAKNRTIIENNAYIGSNNSLVAPITIGAHAYTAAGSTITDDVPDNALAIARAYQVIKKDYTKR